jgi:hypothetical protein
MALASHSNWRAALACLVIASLAGSVQSANLTPGNLVVVRLGTGAAPLTSAATAVFLDEYTPAGVLVQTLALPTAASGSQQPFANSGTASSEGYLSLSVDGRYLLQAGYGAAPGLASIASTASATTPRVVARIAMDGSIDTSTALADAYSGANIRSACSTNGFDLWTGGTSSATGGVRHATLGATTSTQISTTITNSRVVGIHAGQLHTSSAVLNFQGISTVGTGLPTTSGQACTLLPGFPTAVGPSSYDWCFADASTLYVADDRSTTAGGGLQKWTLAGGTWTLAYTLSAGLTAGLRGVSLVPGTSPASLCATSADSATKLVTVVDTGAGSTFSVLAVAAPNTAWRGVRALPVPAATSFCAGDGAGTACPCGNSGTAPNGCANSVNASGANLSAAGLASVALDSFVLQGTGMPNSSALYFQGTLQAGGGAGVAFGDGLRCAAGVVVRLGTTTNSGGSSSYPNAVGTIPVSIKGAVSPGATRTYQVWYRNAAAYCTASTFNLTNGVATTWLP